MEEERSETPYERALRNGGVLIGDSLAQIASVCGMLQKKTAPDGVSILAPSPVVARALKGAVILHEFSALEATANFLADLAVETSNGLPGSPAVLKVLEQVELDFLMEMRTEIDPSTGGLRTRGAYPPTIDKLAIVPVLLSRVHGREFRLDKVSTIIQNSPLSIT